MTDFEVVIPDYADEYDTFLEYFDKQIKSSRLKRVDKRGIMEWDLSGGILSKGRVSIFRSSSNIIWKIKSEIDVLPIILILAFWE